MDMNFGGGVLVGVEYRVVVDKRQKKWDNFNSIINKTYFKKKLIIPLKSSLSHYYRLRLYSKKIVNGTRETEMFAIIVQARNDI